MAEVDVNGEAYETYADIEAADLYAGGATHATAYLAADAIVKGRALVTATRIIDRQIWLGVKYDSYQLLQWPRSGTGIVDVEDAEVPQNIIDATIELAIALVDGVAVQTDEKPQKIQSLRAGSAGITYFPAAESSSKRFPFIVFELIRYYLTGRNMLIAGVLVSGVDGESVTADDLGVNGPL